MIATVTPRPAVSPNAARRSIVPSGRYAPKREVGAARERVAPGWPGQVRHGHTAQADRLRPDRARRSVRASSASSQATASSMSSGSAARRRPIRSARRQTGSSALRRSIASVTTDLDRVVVEVDRARSGRSTSGRFAAVPGPRGRPCSLAQRRSWQPPSASRPRRRSGRTACRRADRATPAPRSSRLVRRAEPPTTSAAHIRSARPSCARSAGRPRRRRPPGAARSRRHSPRCPHEPRCSTR